MSAVVPILSFAYPGDLSTRTGGYIYDARLIGEMRKLEIEVRTIALADDFPTPAPVTLERAIERMSASSCDPLIVDGLAFGTLGEQADALARDRRLIALVHHPLGYETGLDPILAARLIASERAALRHADAVIVTSPTTAKTLVDDFAVRTSKIAVAVPGQDPKPLARRRPPPGQPLQILAVGSITPRKDFASLLDALHALTHLPWRLTIAGSTSRDLACARALRAQLESYSWQDRVELAGEIEVQALDELYARSQIFVSSSRYEGYGMALMDAIGFGLPIVAVKGGAVEQVLPSDAALFANASDRRGLSNAIGRLLIEPALRAKLADAAQQARNRLPRWSDCARIVADTALS